MDLGKILKGGFWGYIGNLISLITGYIYWMVASTMVKPNIVGNAAAIIAFYTLLASLFSLGLQTGIKRFIGISFGEDNFLKLSKFFFTTLVILICLNIPIIIFLVYSIFNPISFIKFNSIELTFVAILFLLNFTSPLFISLFTSIIKTEVIAKGYIISAIMKMSLGILLLYYIPSLYGIMCAFIIALVTFNFILFIYTVKIFMTKKTHPKIDLNLSKDIIKASIPAYLPAILTLLGQSLGTLIVFQLVGEFETGLFFIAFSIATIVYALPQSILSLMYPILSGMKEGQDKATIKVINLSLAITAPIVVILGIYASIPLSFFSKIYMDALPLLTILIIGALFFPIYAGYYGYIYAIGEYKHVTMLGITFNGSRIILYFILVVFLGEFGIALSYSLGVIIALFVMIISIKKLKFSLNWIFIFKILIIPVFLGFILYFFDIFWYLGIPILIVIPLISYLKMNILTKNELDQIISGFVPEKTRKFIYQKAQPLIQFFFKEN